MTFARHELDQCLNMCGMLRVSEKHVGRIKYSNLLLVNPRKMSLFSLFLRAADVLPIKCQECTIEGWKMRLEKSCQVDRNQDNEGTRTLDPNKILLILSDVLQEYSAISNSCSSYREEIVTHHSSPKIDINNNNKKDCMSICIPLPTAITEVRLTKSAKDCSIKADVDRNEKFNSCCRTCPKKKKLEVAFENVQCQVDKFTETGECTCDSTKRCSPNFDCGYRCCDSRTLRSISSRNKEFDCREDADALTRKATCVSRYSTEWKKVPPETEEGEEIEREEQQLESYARQLRRCKELLVGCSFSSINDYDKQVKHGDEKDVNCAMEVQKRESERSAQCANDYVETPPCVTNSTPMLITDGQGLVEIHIQSLQLATTAADVLGREDLSNVSLFISWDIWGQETVRTQPLKCSKLHFNSSFAYRIPELYTFFNCVLSEYVIFQANVLERKETSCVVARAKLCIKEILDYPQNKLHYIAPMNSVIPRNLGVNFGQLSLWVRLSCDLKQVEAFKVQCGLVPSFEQLETPQDETKSNMEKSVQRSVQERSARQSEDDKPDEPTTYKSLGVDVSDDISSVKSDKHRSSSLEKRKDMEESVAEETKSVGGSTDFTDNSKYVSRQSTSIRDMTEVFDEKNWERYKQKSLAAYSNVAKSRFSTEENNEDVASLIDYEAQKDTIFIEIVDVTLFQNSSVMHDEDVRLLYVEYSFLGHRGADMETESVKKPKLSADKLVYNFRRKFFIDEENHAIERNTLRAMLDESINPSIKFILISEPLPEETDVKDCVEVGYAYFNIREFALGDDHYRMSLPIMNHNQSERIGLLKIIVLGLHAIRQCLGDDL